MAFIRDSDLDALLAAMDTNCEEIHITTNEVTLYANLAANTLGNKTSPTTTLGDRTPNGREVVVSAINDGTVTGNGTAAWWCAVDETGNSVLASGALASSQPVTSPNVFTLTEFAVGVPDAVSE